MDNTIKLCRNTDCEQFPPSDEEEWQKCSLCDGYFHDDGLGDILFIEEEPNNQQGKCDLCGKTKNIVQMKETGQYICENACDESDEEEEEGG